MKLKKDLKESDIKTGFMSQYYWGNARPRKRYVRVRGHYKSVGSKRVYVRPHIKRNPSGNLHFHQHFLNYTLFNFGSWRSIFSEDYLID
jgi:hypothetical protein